jgi:hypothetical protein
MSSAATAIPPIDDFVALLTFTPDRQAFSAEAHAGSDDD